MNFAAINKLRDAIEACNQVAVYDAMTDFDDTREIYDALERIVNIQLSPEAKRWFYVEACDLPHDPEAAHREIMELVVMKFRKQRAKQN